MCMPIDIVIADPQPIFRAGLRDLLETVDSFDLIGEAVNGKAALKVITDSEPDVAILDIDLPEKDGFEVARTLFARSMPVEVVFYSIHTSEICFNTALNLGVKGYVLKYSETQELIDAVKTVSEGECFVSSRLASLLAERNRRKKLFTKATPAFTKLTPGEKRILILVGQYMTSKDIAAELSVSVRTVEHHRKRIAAKLGLHGTHSLLKFALENQNEIA